MKRNSKMKISNDKIWNIIVVMQGNNMRLNNQIKQTVCKSFGRTQKLKAGIIIVELGIYA